MVEFQVVMTPLSQALGLSLVVERLIEFGKNVVEPTIRPSDVRASPDPADARNALDAAESLAAHDAASQAHEEAVEAKVGERATQSTELQKIREQLLTETDDAARTKLILRAAELRKALVADEQHGEWEERVPNCVILVEPATEPDDGQTVRAFVIQILGVAVGILLATVSNLSLFGAFLHDSVIPGWQPWMDHILTGVFIGGGSAPVHTLIRFISERKTTAEAAELAVEETPEEKALPTVISAATAAMPSPDTAAGAFTDIPYQGGVDAMLLQSVHRRTKNPELVVYHHTAMSSESTFDDVVRVIKSRKDADGHPWLTGYNCVILADGSIHAFCRWDRYGCHAVGYNRQSLGISFNGNFETNPTVPYSNADGRYGAPRPTDPQLRAGARVVALWTVLYPIPVDFAHSIIPHRQIASKACPGSNFPYDEFQRLVKFYRDSWDTSADAKQRIAAFQLKPYLFV
jgi:hypothetical protein